RLFSHGKPNVRALATWCGQCVRRYAHNRDWLPVQMNRLAHNASVSTKTALPKTVADHDHWSRANGAVDGWIEHAPKGSPSPQLREVIRGHERSARALYVVIDLHGWDPKHCHRG